VSIGQLWRDTLTEREAEIVELVARGDPNKIISRDLGVSESTVKFYLSSAMVKVDVTNRVQLARWWWESIEMCPVPFGWEGSE